MVIFESASLYLDSSKTLKERIKKFDEIIAALEVSELKAAETGNIQSYSLNDGQTVINTTYRSSIEIATSIMAFERQRERLINKLNGRTFRLMDSKNFPR